MSDRRRFLLFAALFFMIQAPIGVTLPFLVLYLKQNVGLSGREISYVTGISGLTVILFQQVWGYLADAVIPKKTLIIGNSILSALCFYYIGMLHSLPQIMAVMFIFNILYTCIVQILHAFLFTHEGTENRFGGLRAWGSLGFVVTNVSIGLAADRFAHGNLHFIFPTFAIMTSLGALMILTLREPARTFTSRPSFWHVQRHFLAKPDVVAFLIVAFFYQAAHTLSYALQSLLMLEMGASKRLIAASTSLGALLEIPIFFTANRLIRRFGEVPLIAFAAAIQTLRWILVYSAPTAGSIVAISALHCITFGVFYACAVSYMNHHAGPHLKASAQTVFAFVYFGLATLFGNFVGGQVMGGGGLATFMTRAVVAITHNPAKSEIHNLYIFCAGLAALSCLLSFAILPWTRLKVSVDK